MGRYAAKSDPAKATRYFLAGKLPWGLRRSGYIICSWGTKSAV